MVQLEALLSCLQPLPFDPTNNYQRCNMPARLLDRNAGTEIPTNLIFFDTECISTPCEKTPEKRLLTLRMWCGVHVRLAKDKTHCHKIEFGIDGKSFWNWVDSCLVAKKKTWLFGHNVAFDLTQLDFWDELDNGRYTIDPLLGKPNPKTGEQRRTWRGALCLESSPFFVCCRQDRKTINIVDTLNYWRMPLAELGQSCGLPKLDMPSDDATMEDWQKYCHRDVEILVRSVVELLLDWQREDCGVFQLTAAMLSLTSFRHKCEFTNGRKHKLDIVCDPDSRWHDLERQSYYGGRTTCYQVGTIKGPVYHVDVNSLYPFVMREHGYPRCFEYSRHGVPVGELQSAQGIYGTVAQCLIDTRHQTFPARIDGQQYHCTGHYWTSLCGPELSRALRSGLVLRAGNVQYYSIASYFTEWVDYWYDRKTRAMRELGNGSSVYRLSKIILNSLSGKFAQQGKRWAERPGRVPLLRWGGYTTVDDGELRPMLARGVAGVEQVLTDVGEPRYSFPAISAFITSHGREYMQSVIDTIGEANVYYLATDALIVNQDGYDQLLANDMIDQYRLGAFKLVGTYDECDIRGANYYSLDGTVTAAGLVGLAENARLLGRAPETFQPIGSIISVKPDASVAVSPLSPPTFTPDYRGTIGNDGRWLPYRVTLDPEWTDRPPRSGYSFGDSLDTEARRILLAADV